MESPCRYHACLPAITVSSTQAMYFKMGWMSIRSDSTLHPNLLPNLTEFTHQAALSIALYTALLLVVTVRVAIQVLELLLTFHSLPALQTPNWTIIHHICYWASLGLWCETQKASCITEDHFYRWLFVCVESLVPTGLITNGSMFGCFSRWIAHAPDILCEARCISNYSVWQDIW